MLKDLFKKWKKYPFNKRKDPPKAVYGGPEYFRQKAGPRPKEREPEEADIEVYAGPEYFERSGDPEKEAPLPPEEDLPEPEEDLPEPPEEILKPVYAGPEAMDRGPALMVYAGPQYFVGRGGGIGMPPPDPPMPVYAGPEFYGAGEPMAPVPGQTPPEGPEKPDSDAVPAPDDGTVKL